MSDTDAKLAQVKTQATKDYEVALQAGSKDVDATKKDGKARLLARAKQLETANDVLRKHPVGMDALVMEGRQSVAKGWVQKSDTTLAEQVAAVVAKVVAKLVGAAPSLADQAIRAQVEPLRQTVATKRSKAQQAIVAARAQAGQKLLEAKNQALQALEVARGKIGQRTAAEADRALGRIEVAVNQRRDRTFTVGDDAIAAIDQLHADRQQLYDTVAAYLDKKSPVPAPLLTAVRDALADASSVHLRELESLAATKNTELAAAFQREDGRFATAVKGQHAEAAKFGSKLQSEAKASGDAFATLVKGVASKFSLSTDKAVAPVRTAASGFQKSAEAKVGKQKTKLVAGQVAAAKKGVKAEYDGLVKGLAAKLDAAGSKKAMSERGKLVVETRNLRDAMDGFGTDEAKIHGVLRRASYGGIEALKVLYDMRYTHRRGKKYNQALYDDLDDEMSGDDLRLALLYLKHSRKEAIALDLKMAVGFFNDDEARIEEIMRGCSLDEIKSLHSNGNAELIATVQSHLGGHDRDAFDALLKVGDPKWTEDEWKTRRSAEANAIRLHEAMDGMGTDEAKVLQLLEEAKTDEERKYLREYFKSYSDKKDWFPPKDLDDALSGELSGSDKMLATVLAKEKRDDDEVAAAKMLHAGSGMGTDEKKLFEAMKDPKFEAKISQFDTEIESLQKAMEGVKDKDQRAILQQRLDAKKKEKGKAIDERKATLGKHIATLSEGDYKNVDQYLSSELGSTSGKGDDNLERQMADKILEKGTVDRATQIRYASAGLGTNEDDLTAALTGDDGEPLSKAELAKLDAEYMQKYGKSIRTEVNGETAFTDAKGKVVSGGKTYKELDMLLDGKPETIQDLRTQAEKRKTIETSGFGATVGRAADWLGFTDTYTDYDAGHKRLMEELSSSEEKYRKAHPDKKDEPVKLSDLGTEMGGEGDRLMLLSQFDQGDAKAFGKFKESMVDSLVTVLEVIGAAVATILTAGAAAPALAAVLSSLVVSAVGIGFKYVMLGDNYLDQLGNDLMVALATAPLAALGELKAVGKVADKAGKGIGKNVGKVVNGIADAADKAGFKWVGKIRLSEKSIEKFSKLAGKGVSSVLTDTPTDAVTAALDEKSWDKGADEWGKNLLGSTMSSVGNNFKGGMIKGGVGGKFDEKWDEKLGPSKSYWMAGLKGASKATTVSTAKFMLDPSSYADDGNMLERFGKASLTASWKGAVNSAAERKSAIVGFERRMRRGEAIGEADYDTLSMMTEEELAGVANRLPAEKVPTALKGYRKPDASEKAKLEGTEDHEHDATTTKKADDKTSTKTEESPADVERRKTQLQMAEHAEALIHSGDHKGAAFVMEKLYLQLTHESMKDTPIGKVLLKATTHEEKMGIAAEYATYLAVMDKNPRDLDPDRMSAVIRTHSRLYQQLELGTTMRKFFSAEDTDAWLSQKYGAASVGGSVGVAKNTEGLDAHQVISVLGLDYTAGGKQPFLKPDGKPVDHVFFVEYSLTEAHKQQAKVPMDSKLVEHAKEMAAKGDKEAQTFLDQIHERDADYVKDEHGKPVLDEKGKPVRDYSNPFMGLGGTSHGSLFKGTSTKVGNQELQMMERQKLGEGTVMYALDQKGAKTKVAVLSIVEPGKPLKWVMDESLATTDPVLASQVQISLAKANEKD